MRCKHLIGLPLLLLCLTAAVFSQDNFGNLKSWDGKTPTDVDDKGKVIANFWALPEIQKPLKRLLTPADYNLVTKAYAVEAPFKLMGDFLGTSVCRPHNCGDERAGFAINLKTGDMYVRMAKGTAQRWIVSKGKASDLPAEVQDQIK